MRTLAIALAATVLALGQKPANFSGTWKMDPKRSESAHQDVPTGASTLVIRQTPGSVSIETRRTEEGKPDAFHETIVFRTDGKETTSVGDGGASVTAKMRWDGAKLVAETARNVQDSTITTLYTHSLSADGRELTIDKSLTVQHGYQFEGSRTTGTGRDVYVRTAK